MDFSQIKHLIKFDKQNNSLGQDGQWIVVHWKGVGLSSWK
jgi:hypothetical protein